MPTPEMSELETIAEATPLLQKQTGIVIPVYLPPGESRALAAALLRDLVQACLNEIDDPANICLSVDGAESGAEVASQLAREFAVSIVVGVVCRVVPRTVVRAALGTRHHDLRVRARTDA